MSRMVPVESPAAQHPPLGTLIDEDTLQLVELLGVGGYGVVYRAVDAFSSSYAVKCLISNEGSSLRRQLHIREITLHQLASAHPGVVTLHRVVEERGYTYIIMEYASDNDLFSQILHESRYLGDDQLLKHIFLQLVDAVDYCHSLGIYHRDLKPENILCFDRGHKIAITDFGLATTEKSSKEFRTGSVYHMSPECQAGDSERPAPYSPMFNDVWSLGIILVNLATGRNPWKSATPDDSTFQAYRQDPLNFLPTVLPISHELNKVLVRVLSLDWKSRYRLHEFRAAIEKIDSFYSDSVVFEGSLARCPWEEGLDLGNSSTRVSATMDKHFVPHPPTNAEPYSVASTSNSQDALRFDGCCVWEVEQENEYVEDELDESYPSTSWSYSSNISFPRTPCQSGCDPARRPGVRLTIDTNHVRYHDNEDASSTDSSTEPSPEAAYASSFFLESPIAGSDASSLSSEPPQVENDKTRSPTQSIYSYREVSVFSDDSSESGEFERDYSVGSFHISAEESDGDRASIIRIPEIHTPIPASKPIDIIGGGGKKRPRKTKMSSIFNTTKLFPRPPGRAWGGTVTTKATIDTPHASSSPQAYPPSPPIPSGSHPQTQMQSDFEAPMNVFGRQAQRQVRSPRQWFPTKFFTVPAAADVDVV